MNSNDRSILSITMLGHGMVHMYELAIPIFITVWIQDFGVDAAVLGAVVAAGYALYGIGAVPSGIAADTYGSKRVLIVCLLGMGGSFLLLGLFDTIAGVMGALLLWGTAASIYHPAGLRLISMGVSRRGTGFAYHGIAGNVGIALGPLLASTLLIWVVWQTVAVVMAVPALLVAVYTAYISVDEAATVVEEEQDAVVKSGLSLLREFLGDTRKLFAGGFLIAFPVLILEGFFIVGF
jgi:MFS family permease